MHVFRTLVVIALALTSACAAYGQGFGAIVGTITDSSGAVVPGAKIKITDEATSSSRETVSNDIGYYVAPSLRPSVYTVTVEVAGFGPSQLKGIQLQADQSLTVNHVMRLRQTEETVTVSTTAQQVNTTTATNSEVVDQRRVEDLPLNGRNAASLLTIVAGAIPANPVDADQGTTKTFPAVVTVSSNGSRANQTTFRLDGASNMDVYTNVNMPFPFPDALQEFSVQTANYPARYGGLSGGVVNVITRAGSNQYHGAAFNFNRNEIYNARNFFGTSRDKLKRNQFGATLGGPLAIPGLLRPTQKDFFFFGYQGTRMSNVSTSSNATVPTAANVGGDFSNLLDASNPSNPFGRSIQVLDPTNGAQFAGNIIPTSRLDPASVKLAKYLPVVQSGTGLVYFSQPSRQNMNEAIARFDHNFSEQDQLTGRYFFDRYQQPGYLNDSNYLSNVNYASIDAHNAMVSETHLFSPSLLNELRVSYVRETAARGPADGSISVGDLGVAIFQPATKLIESLQVEGYFSVSQTSPAQFVRNQYALNEDLTWIKGKHTISVGAALQKAQVLVRNAYRTAGNFSFSNNGTNNAMASFMLGYLRTFTQGGGQYQDNAMFAPGAYIQDDFHVSRRLTLNVGLRWDPFVPWIETRNRVQQFRISDYEAGIGSSLYANAPVGLRFAGEDGVSQSGINSAYGNLAPRLGFAWDVFGDGKTSLRGGAGTFYDTTQPGTIMNRIVNATPFSTQVSYTDPQGSFSNPYLGKTNPYPASNVPAANSAFPTPVTVLTYDPANGGQAYAPVIYTWNLMLERQLPHDWLLRAGYVGSRSLHIGECLELNPGDYIPGSTLGTDARRPYQPYGAITQWTQDIQASFHSMQLTAQKRLSNGLTVLANYTWSKSIDDVPWGQYVGSLASYNGSPIRWWETGRHDFDRGPSEFDRTHRMVLSYIYDLPKLAHANRYVRAVAGGWQWTGILTYQSGSTWSVWAGKDQSKTGLGTDRADYIGGDPYGPGACGNMAPCVDYLNRAAFALPAVGSAGNIGKGRIRMPDLLNLDTGVFKEFPLFREGWRLQFRGEFFNATNRVNFNNPSTTYTDGTFGAITSAGSPRIGQLGLKMSF